MREEMDRMIHTLTQADPGVAIVVGTCRGGGMIVHITRGSDPRDLVHMGRSLLNNALEWMDEDGAGAGMEDHPLFNEVEECVDILRVLDCDGYDG